MSGMEKSYTIAITDHQTGATNTFETNSTIGAYTAKEYGEDKSFTTHYALGAMTPKELIKLVAGCLDSVYRSIGDEVVADEMIKMAHHLAKAGYKMHKEQK